MDEAWERAVEAARGGEDAASVRDLTLDGAVKFSQGRLPSASLLAQFSQLRRLSIANVGLVSLAEFPSLPYLERLILSDNRIAGGLEFLVAAGLVSLRDLDLSNNKIQVVEELAPLAKLNLVSLDLYECPVTRLPNYRIKVFAMIKSLQFLDKLDAEDNERPESDDEDEDDEDDVDDELGDAVEAEGNDEDVVKPGNLFNFTGAEDDDEADEDEENDDEGDESDELDEEDDDAVRFQEAGKGNNVNQINEVSGSDEDEVDDEDDEENVEVQDVDESEEEGGEDEDGGEEDEEEEEEEEEGTEQVGGRFPSTEVESDAQESEDDDEDENGELGDEDEDGDGVDNDGPEDEDEEGYYGSEYLVQPVARPEDEEGASDFEPGEDEDEEDDVEDDEDDDDDDDDDEGDEDEDPAASLKRKRSKPDDEDSDQDERPPKR